MPKKLEPKTDGTLNKYKCRYCKHEFERTVRKIYPIPPGVGINAKHGGGSDQVICPKCKAGLRTWEDALWKS